MPDHAAPDCDQTRYSVQNWSNFFELPALEDWAMMQPHSLERAAFRSGRIRFRRPDGFFNITAAWHLGAEEERVLGSPPRSTFFKWKSDRAARLSVDTLERISYVHGHLAQGAAYSVADSGSGRRVGEEAHYGARSEVIGAGANARRSCG